MSRTRERCASWIARIVLVACVVLQGCTDVTTNLVSDPKDASAARHDASTIVDAAIPLTDARVDATAADSAASLSICGDHVCACSDGQDSDGDTLIDGFDPECTGPFDDDEASFATGTPIPHGACRDCFWDDNAGSGDDECRYPRECLTGVTSNGKGKCGGSGCTADDACVDHCLARTPNGCDCFGCCDIVRSDGTSLQIELNDACSVDKLDDADACPRCVMNPSCMNTCGRCELCPGRTKEQIPDDCGAALPSGAPHYVCEEGQRVCAVTSDCDSEYRYCQQGCCLPILF